MSRVIRVDSPGKQRSQLMRTAAEVIRQLSVKQEVDEEARDMAALLVYCFREIDAGIDESVTAWEKRDYWLKTEKFRLKWRWVRKAAVDLDDLVRKGQWELLPATLIGLLPEFQDIKIAKFTRNSSLWKGAYRRLMQEHARSEEVQL